MTKRDKLVEISEILSENDCPTLVEFIDKEIAAVDKRANAPRKPTSNQIANEALKAEIADMLTAGAMTATDVATFKNISVQKASQLLRQLVAEGIVTRTDATGKEKARFAA